MLRRVAAIVVMAGMGMTGEARAEVSCHMINARGVGQDLGGGATEAEICALSQVAAVATSGAPVTSHDLPGDG
jgi:hypothetical protein